MNSTNNEKVSIDYKKKIYSYFKKIIPLIGIIILIIIIYEIGINKIIETFLQISPLYVLIAAGITFPRLFLRTIQWKYLLKKQKIKIGFLKTMKIFLISYFYGSITPGYLGMSIRIPYLKEETNEPWGKLFINSFLETIVHGLSLYIMLIIGAFFIAKEYPEVFYVACIFVGISLLIYAYFINKNRGEKLLFFLIKIFIPKKLTKLMNKFVGTFYMDFPKKRDFIIPFIIGIPAWVLIYSQIYIISLSLDIQIPYFLFIVIYPIANIIAFLPITSAGLGTREATLIFLFSIYGVDPAKTVVLSLAGHLLTDVLTGLYGLVIAVFETSKRKDMVVS
jgi:uncharacterized protein (TIRG00374 family)